MLVTGSNGFLGSHLVEELVRRGHDVFCLVRHTSNLRWLNTRCVRLIYGDVTSQYSLREAVAGKDHIYHVAGLVKASSQWAFDRVNVRGTANLLEACSKHNPAVGKFVFISSQSAGGPSRMGRPATEDDPAIPVSRYGKSKLKAETAARLYMERFPVTIIRPPAIFGPRDYGMLPFFKMLTKGLVILVAGDRYANFAYVKDIVTGTILAGEKEEAAGQTYYLAGQRPHSWREFAEAAAGAIGKRVAVISVPPAAVRAVGGFNTLIGAITGNAMMLDWYKAHEILQPYWVCNTTKARRELGYRPAYSLDQALPETIAWYESQGWI